MKLREEVENPFRKVRFFFLWAFVASGTVGLLIATLRLLALTQGIDQGQTYSELLQNMAIDLGAIVLSGVFIKRDIEAQDSRLRRMEIGARLAALKVRMQAGEDTATIPLSAFRRQRGRDKRVAIVVGGAAAVAASLASSRSISEQLTGADIVIVPLVLERPRDSSAESAAATGESLICGGAESQLEEAVGQQHIALPVMLNQWQEWVSEEVLTAQGQGFDVLNDGFAVILKKNGRVGTRSRGCPPWNVLVGDVQARIDNNMDTTNI